MQEQMIHELDVIMRVKIEKAEKAATDILKLARWAATSNFIEVVPDKITVKMEVPTDERLSDLLCCAMEGGSNYWYCIEAYNYPPGQSKETLKVEFRHLELPFIEGCSLTISYPCTDDDYDRTTRVLDRAAMLRGIKLMAEKYPKHYADFVEENDDAITGDVFLQCALLGDVIFG